MFQKSNRALGIGLLVVGLIFVGINWYSINFHSYYFPKLLAVGAIVSCLGLGFSLFPGGQVDPGNQKTFFKDKWKNSRPLDRLMWILFTLIGIALAAWLFVYFDLKV